MSDLLKNGLNDYLDRLLPERDPILKEMEKYASQQNFPIVGPQVGRFLCQLAYLTKPEVIFEMGSGFGYSAYWFSLGAPNATIIHTELNPRNIRRAQKWFKSGKKEHQIVFKQGRAQDILAHTPDFFDLIFIDVDKYEYPQVFSLALTKVKQGGLIIIDNVLWYGKVTSVTESDHDTLGVWKLNEMLFQTTGVLSSIIPIRDGLGLCIKL
jgi:caffeoyl-CoA O-methyltransferase